MFMLRQTSVKMAVLLHKQASDRFHSLLTVCGLSPRLYNPCVCIFLTSCFMQLATTLRGVVLFPIKVLCVRKFSTYTSMPVV